ncbi:MAG: hypothetical protein ACTH9L_09825, partial [Microbacterium gubbeenense]
MRTTLQKVLDREFSALDIVDHHGAPVVDGPFPVDQNRMSANEPQAIQSSGIGVERNDDRARGALFGEHAEMVELRIAVII